MSAANVELVRGSFAAINARDLDAILAHFSDDVVFDGSRVMEGVYRGKPAFRRFLEELIAAAELRYEDLTLLDAGERVVALGTIRGRGAASSAPMERRMGFVYEIEAGLISRQELYPDGEALLESLGLER